jgi:hypothetical protein
MARFSDHLNRFLLVIATSVDGGASEGLVSQCCSCAPKARNVLGGPVWPQLHYNIFQRIRWKKE